MGATLFSATPAFAQSVFCPNGTVTNQIGDFTYTGNSPYSLQGGNCTNGFQGSGAFSGAALASQSLSSLSQSTTTESNRNVANSIDARRQQEAQRAANAQAQARSRADAARDQADTDRRRRAGSARAQAAAAERAEAAAAAQRARSRATAARARQAEAAADARSRNAADAAAMARRAAARAEANRAARAEAAADTVRMREMRRRVRMADPRDTVIAEPAPQQGIVRKGYDPLDYVIAPEGPRFGVFAQGFGDYERRSGSTNAIVTYNFGGAVPPQPIDLQSVVLQNARTVTAGFQGGIDVTSRNVFAPGDGLIAGLLAGYTDTSINISTRVISLNQTLLADGGSLLLNGQASTRVSLTGPSVGAFATYFYNGFSIDQALKADFFDLDQNFSQTLAFGGFARQGRLLSGLVSTTGSGGTDLTQLSAIGNINYRFVLSPTLWFEPTVGYQYTNAYYDEASAAQLGLSDGHLWRVQGGARVGYETMIGNTRLTTILTGLAYENTTITGGFIQGGAFGSNTLALNDQGKLRGQAILTFAADHGNGWSTFIQGNVRGGDEYFAAGGRAGFRYGF